MAWVTGNSTQKNSHEVRSIPNSTGKEKKVLNKPLNVYKFLQIHIILRLHESIMIG